MIGEIVALLIALFVASCDAVVRAASLEKEDNSSVPQMKQTKMTDFFPKKDKVEEPLDVPEVEEPVAEVPVVAADEPAVQDQQIVAVQKPIDCLPIVLAAYQVFLFIQNFILIVHNLSFVANIGAAIMELLEQLEIILVAIIKVLLNIDDDQQRPRRNPGNIPGAQGWNIPPGWQPGDELPEFLRFQGTGMQPYYDTLEIASTTDRSAIRAAHRRLARVHHPDRGGDSAKFRAVQQAYEHLCRYHERRGTWDEPNGNVNNASAENGGTADDIQEPLLIEDEPPVADEQSIVPAQPVGELPTVVPAQPDAEESPVAAADATPNVELHVAVTSNTELNTYITTKIFNKYTLGACLLVGAVAIAYFSLSDVNNVIEPAIVIPIVHYDPPLLNFGTNATPW